MYFCRFEDFLLREIMIKSVGNEDSPDLKVNLSISNTLVVLRVKTEQNQKIHLIQTPTVTDFAFILVVVNGSC